MLVGCRLEAASTGQTVEAAGELPWAGGCQLSTPGRETPQQSSAEAGPTSLMLRSVSSASLTRACTMPLVCLELFSVLISCSSSRMLPLASFSSRRILSSRSCRCSPVLVCCLHSHK